jgi:protein-S-isoprenylcysteine O-methyltransferase Ste14
MTKRDFLSKHRIVRSAIREDLLYFALPAILIFTTGLVVSARDGWVDLLPTLWDLIRQPRSISVLSVQNILGIALFVGGFTILLIAQITLFRNYSSTLVIREDHQLITHGIYHFTRHPIYLGVILVATGLPVYGSSLYGILIMSAMIPVFLVRIKIEERLLTEEFGDAYRAYMQTTRKLIPFIF